MAADNRSQTVVPSPDPNYLLRLRERALSRMQKDEQLAGITGPGVSPPMMSRRSSLRMIGLAAAGMAAGALRARADGVASLRSAAPQYGAPTWPSPGVVFERPEKLPTYKTGIPVVSDRGALGEPSSWIKVSITVLPADGRNYTGYGLPRLDSRVIYYGGSSDKPHALEAVEDPATGNTYVVPGGQAFYIRENADLLGVLFSPTTLTIRKALFRTKTKDAGVDEAIRRFASEASPEHLAKEEKDRVEIDLHTTLPRDQWSMSGWIPPLISVSALGHILEFHVGGLNPMRVDWQAKKLLTGSTT